MIDDLGCALEDSNTLLEELSVLLHKDMYSEFRVSDAERRVKLKGGSAAWIAEQLAYNKELVKKLD